MSGKKFQSPKKSNFIFSHFFSLELFFIFLLFIWNQICYRDGRPLILKLIPNNEKKYDKIARFNWNRQRFTLVALFATFQLICQQARWLGLVYG